jgi:hypothetical protein
MRLLRLLLQLNNSTKLLLKTVLSNHTLTKMNKEPLTPEEVLEASNQFFPLFDIVHRNMPEGSKTEDTLKVMETVCTLAHKLRAEKEEQTAPFGFNKKDDGTAD